MNLLFDLDGTLTNPFQGITGSIIYALEKMGVEPPSRQSLAWCIGPSLLDSFARLLACDDHAQSEKALAYYRERFGTVGLFENQVYEGVDESLRYLQDSGNTLFVATSKPTVYAQKIVDYFDLDRYFSRVYGSELDGTRSDKTDLLAHIVEKESIEPADTIMIGDRKYDIIAANENGIRGVGVLWGYGTKEELEDAGALRIVERPAELIVDLFLMD